MLSLVGSEMCIRDRFTSVVCLVNVLKLTQFWVLFSSLLSCVYQVSLLYVHPPWPVGVIVLLTYTHSSLSASVALTAFRCCLGAGGLVCWLGLVVSVYVVG
jgi:hypothetical protein